jgi:hypothetical protein
MAGGRCSAEEFADCAHHAVETLIENGWVHTDVTGEDIEYSFSSPLHMWRIHTLLHAGLIIAQGYTRFCTAALKLKDISGEMPYQYPLELAVAAIL